VLLRFGLWFGNRCGNVAAYVLKSILAAQGFPGKTGPAIQEAIWEGRCAAKSRNCAGFSGDTGLSQVAVAAE
jgi:hypothetical protein